MPAQKPFNIPTINNEKLALMSYLNLNENDDADYNKVVEFEGFMTPDSRSLSGAARVAVFEVNDERYHVTSPSTTMKADVVKEYNSNLWAIKKITAPALCHVASDAASAHLTQPQALRAALSWIDQVPSHIPLPAMPGFDRDLVENLIADQMIEGHPELTFPEAIDMALEWIDAVPVSVIRELQLPELDRIAIEAARDSEPEDSIAFEI